MTVTRPRRSPSARYAGISLSTRDCAALLRLVAEPTRLAVLRLVAAVPLSVNEIAERLDVEQTLLSHHLALLRRSGLVSVHRDGKHQLYKLAERVQLNDTADGIDFGCCRLQFF
ncbi:metalloregulator ArsR/SmtB family transcription factor [Nevskia sp.]|uniref:ArsR/SmtB family transcription factor n=1 Tax=Nevskia sp. TaxID=1929292 RepID=UPI0025D6C25B|nr:metalloregulator ArsR/SmtB family transcription factor [Nevskia sp.]